MYSSTLNAAEASARPMRESRTQLPARRPVDDVEARVRGRQFFFTRLAALQPQRAGTLAAPIGQRHRVFWALAVRCALILAAWKRAACLFLGSTPSRRSPSMRSSYCRHGGFYTAPLAAFLRQSLLPSRPEQKGTAARLRSQYRFTVSPLAARREL